MVIKVVLTAAVVVVGIFLMRRQTERYQAVRRLLLGGFVLAAVACILYPDALTVVARWLNVGRGTDLLLYALIVAFLGYVVTSYSRERRMQERLTVLARRIALTDAGPPRRSADTAAPAGGQAIPDAAAQPGRSGGSIANQLSGAPPRAARLDGGRPSSAPTTAAAPDQTQAAGVADVAGTVDDHLDGTSR